MQHIKLEPGVLGGVFEKLRLKVVDMTKMERECVYTLDEMSITQCVELHTGTGKLFKKDVTLPGQKGAATHVCLCLQDLPHAGSK